MEQCYKFNEDNEWYTREEDIINFLNISKLNKIKTIWCPFDNNNSNFVRVLKEQGFNIINSHISEGKDFYNYLPDKKIDLILSNPPFRGKQKTLERIKELNIPFALIYGIQCFNSGGFVKELKNFDNLQMIFLTKRIKFFKDYENQNVKLPNPTFHSMWICNGLGLEKDITIW